MSRAEYCKDNLGGAIPLCWYGFATWTGQLCSNFPRVGFNVTRLSCHRFRSNEVRLWLSVIAYNLGNLWRRLVKHARYYWLLLAESHLTRRLFASMGRRIGLLPLPAG